jgi:tRNA nucleotidyltransferase (CCA-adding enzyme)
MKLEITKQCKTVIQKLRDEKYFSLIVGGKVRDTILGIESKDVDIEVYGITYDDLVEFLSAFGKVNLVGKAFGVIKIKLDDGEDYDFSIPRRDSKVENNVTAGRGIVAEFDINITPEEAASRRIQDIADNILRATSEQFSEDPLRALRGFQFVSRFGFNTDDYTIEVCKTLKGKKLVIERECEEWMKFFTKCKYPGKALQYLIDTEWIERYPEINDVINIPQDLEWHPEGSVGIHMQYCLDAAAKICARENIEGDNKAIIMAGTLGHDLGKVDTTRAEIRDGKERITSKGHDTSSLGLTFFFLKRIGIKNKIIEKSIVLARYHMEHLTYNKNSKKSNARQLAEKVYPATIEDLLWVIEADHSGRPPLQGGLPEKAYNIKKDAIEEGVYEGKAGSYISGDEIVEIFHAQQGKLIGDVLKEVRKKQLRKEVNNKQDAIRVANKYLQSRLLNISGKDVMEIVGVGEGKEIGQILEYAWRCFLDGEKIDLDWLKDFNSKRL